MIDTLPLGKEKDVPANERTSESVRLEPFALAVKKGTRSKYPRCREVSWLAFLDPNNGSFCPKRGREGRRGRVRILFGEEALRWIWRGVLGSRHFQMNIGVAASWKYIHYPSSCRMLR